MCRTFLSNIEPGVLLLSVFVIFGPPVFNVFDKVCEGAFPLHYYDSTQHQMVSQNRTGVISDLLSFSV